MQVEPSPTRVILKIHGRFEGGRKGEAMSLQVVGREQLVLISWQLKQTSEPWFRSGLLWSQNKTIF